MDDKELADQARLLIELNEPEALLESLKRVCQRKAASAHGSQEAKRWSLAASALDEATKGLLAPQEPHGAAHEPDKPIPQPVPAEGEASSTG